MWTQGDKILSQPYSNTDESKLFLFNGDIYSFTGFQLAEIGSMNDGEILFEKFANCTKDEEICKIVEDLQGPFAFIFVDRQRSCMWFARDFFGRESLLFSYEICQQCDIPASWHLSSVSIYENVIEVPTSGLFRIDLASGGITVFPYSHARKDVTGLQMDFFARLQKSGFVRNTAEGMKINLHFSPKLKQPVLEEKVEPGSSSQNTNVLTSLMKAAENNPVAEGFVEKCVDILSSNVGPFLETLRKSIKRRVFTLPQYCKNCMKTVVECRTEAEVSVICHHAKVGVLFSGGLDSTVIAYLAAAALPPESTLDLINVAFSKDDNFNNVPDRETALASFKMLRAKFETEKKRINLVLVNVGKLEVEEKRRERIKELISPLKSVLDDSVGVCLWFAARGIGQLFDEAETTSIQYSSPIRVVLLGSGADELLGGYGRHRTAYEKFGWPGLLAEMQLEIDRISIRNLGRDNRIVSDHGLCPRMPFLDENVVDFLANHCDIWVKCCPMNIGPLGERGTGEKLLLRAVGAKLFGDQYLSLALFPKRAMQFGSRIAKLENSKEKGGDSCHRLL